MVEFKKVQDRRKIVAAYQGGQYRMTVSMAREHLRLNKADREIEHIYALACLRTGQFDTTIKTLSKLLAAQPGNIGLLSDLGYAYMWAGELQEAHARFDKALALNPDFPPAVIGKAHALDREGDDEGIQRLLSRFVASGTELAPMAVPYARMLFHRGEYQKAAELSLKHLCNPHIDTQARQHLCEQAAKALEKLGEYEKAFAAFSASNRLKMAPFDPAEYAAHMDDVIATYSAANMARLPRSRLRSDVPIFIASMPRSGSTLVEQIIHAHPKAHGAGEITELHQMVLRLPGLLESMQPYPACLGDFTQANADALAKSYLDDLRGYHPRAARIANKHLENYKYLGFVELLLPGARIVHVKRDPLDNCFSCFMAQISPDAYPWVSDLRTLGFAYRQYERLMAHWHEVLKIPILDVQYEDLVEDTDTWIRKIIDFCGLPWDDACLRYWEAERPVMTLSYDQVNKPIYKSAVKRWQKYEAFLGPLKEALAGDGAA